MKNTIRVERAIKDITQQDLAVAVGVSRQTINSFEAARFVPSTVLALRLPVTSERLLTKSSPLKRKTEIYDTHLQHSHRSRPPH